MVYHLGIYVHQHQQAIQELGMIWSSVSLVELGCVKFVHGSEETECMQFVVLVCSAAEAVAQH